MVTKGKKGFIQLPIVGQSPSSHEGYRVRSVRRLVV